MKDNPVGFAAEKIEQNQEVIVAKKAPAEKTSVLDEKFHGKTKRQAILETGELFALVLVLIAAARQYHGRPIEDALYLVTLACALYELSLRSPTFFYPIWKGWMGLGMMLEVVTSKIILILSWFIMVVPVGIMMRLSGAKTIDCTWKKDCLSYWEERAPQDFKLLERQY